MRKGILVALAFMLVACGGNNDKHYYQLPIAPQASDDGQRLPSAVGARHVWLSRVNVSDYLAGSGVVFQESDVRYVTASNNLWASPLEQQLQQTMVANLSNALPGVLVSASQAQGDQDQLEFNVTGFHGRYDGRAIIQGEWLLTHNGQVSRHPFILALKQDQDGYDALVRTLAQGWLQIGKDAAGQISRLP
ncbi:membrane integrity-associated transporter subunit PqiC [Acerihabitans arboris]|uniref:Membrane integrity-associated transporter subunit PqiC n=1 Tax=Acerihabitans arboris TaxID=2691583 RepID=A0A845SL14_9GAMM|nr:membrane integrity-associated transporter subunit PqiC [Acerihabitans arboris]NDL61995.1 membrane integrity-associated transporter subunit PqiC [Acerihabitans arboris]